MSVMNYLKYAFYTLVLATGWLVSPQIAHAQSYSAGSFNAGRETSVVNSCRGEALTLNQRLIEVRQIINQYVECNQNGQIYDGTGCVTPIISPDHEFLRPDSGATLAFQNVDNDSFAAARVIGGANGSDIECEGTSDPDVDPLTCTAPWGGTMEEGDTVYAYRDSSVPEGESCEGQVRTCVGGVLTGSYRNRNCSVEDPDEDPVDCTLPWGGTLGHGRSVTAYQASSVAYGGRCNQETRSCDNGTLSGSFTNQNCTVQDPAVCPLPWGGTLAHGRSVTAYESDSVASGSSCNDQTRSCDNGTLSGTYTNRTCTVREPVTTCRPWQWDFDGWCRGRPQCNNFNILDRACNGDPNCTLRNVNYRINTCAVCNVEAERCYTR